MTRRMDAKKGGKGGRRGNKEEAHFVRGEVISEFAYMVQTLESRPKRPPSWRFWRWTFAWAWPSWTLAARLPSLARRLEFFARRGLPEPVELQLPPVQLKGFNGVKSSTRKGLRWTVMIGSLWGQITTYVVPGSAPFLLSRKVLQGMEATLDLGQSTITSAKHGMQELSLAQASNGHLLLPLVPDLEADSESFNVTSEPGPAPVEETPAGTTPRRKES